MASRNNTPVTFSELTSLGVGGPIEHFVDVPSVAALRDVLHAPPTKALYTIGGGSNILASDEGLSGTVVRLRSDTISILNGTLNAATRVRAESGVQWDRLVAWSVEHGLAGIECMSGIPGSVGAAPIQNIGAYGQEAASSIVSVEVLNRHTGCSESLPANTCGFSYRYSHFKGAWRGRYIITAVIFELHGDGAQAPRYAQLKEAIQGEPLTLQAIRRAVLYLRRQKSMCLDPTDHNTQSAGSFFMNPVMTESELENIHQIAKKKGAPLPSRYEQNGRVKLPAAWLVEQAGFHKGLRRGAVGISSNHSLAIVNLGGARSQAIIEFAAEIRQRVFETFSIRLEPEPVFVGFGAEGTAILELNAKTL